MDLHSYLLELSEQDREIFARQCDTTLNYLWKLARGFDKVPPLRPNPTLAALIERASNQKVRRWESNPEDWHITWPELVGVKGAPSCLQGCMPRSKSKGRKEVAHGC